MDRISWFKYLYLFILLSLDLIYRVNTINITCVKVDIEFLELNLFNIWNIMLIAKLFYFNFINTKIVFS